MDDKSTRDARSNSADDTNGEVRKLAGSRWEWVAAAISFILVLAAIGFLIHDATRPPTSPAIEIAVDSIVERGNGYLVEFHAHNSGTNTAAALQVEGTLRSSSGADEEKSQVTVGYVPGGSSRGAGLFFMGDPREGDLEIRPLGYEQP